MQNELETASRLPESVRITGLVAVLALLLMAAASTSRTPFVEDGRAPRLRLVRTGMDELSATAEAILVTRIRTDETLYARAADQRLPVASLTKLMTALLLAETAHPLELVSFSESVKQIGDPDDKRSTAAIGERLRAEDVARMLLISSDSDAAYAAAEHVALLRRPELAGGSFAERIALFVGLMNERAGTFGLANTHFANPTGSDDTMNYSSASDLARLAAFIADEHPELWALSRTVETFAFGASGRRHGLTNTNPLLGEFPAIYGSKTGYEAEARGALLVLYQLRRGELFAIVLLRSPDRFTDGRAAIRWLEENFKLEP